MPKTKGGYVYLIENTESQMYKIGMTRGSVEKRLKQLQTGSPAKLEIREAYKTDYPYRLETILHNRFSYLNTLGEWYNLPFQDVLRFHQICEDTNKTIELMKDNIFFSKGLC